MSAAHGQAGCPICGQPVVRGAARASAAGASSAGGAPARGKAADPYPFCSARCQLVDLGKWLGEEYRVPDRETVVWPPPDEPER